MSEKELSADVMYKFIKKYSTFSHEDLAGMYAIANKRNVELEDEIKSLRKELREKEERIADASETIKKLKMAVEFDPDLVKLCDEWLNKKGYL